MAIRLAHHSFTLGELSFTAFGATILFTEALHVTITRVSGQMTSVQLSKTLLIENHMLDLAYHDSIHQNV